MVEFVSIHQVIQFCVLLSQVICNCINTTHTLKPGVKDVIVRVFYLLFHIVVTYGFCRVGVGSMEFGDTFWSGLEADRTLEANHTISTVLCCGNGNILVCKPVLPAFIGIIRCNR